MLVEYSGQLFFYQEGALYFALGHFKSNERIFVKPPVLHADVNNLLKIRQVLDRGVVIAFTDRLQPKFIIGNELVVQLFYVDVIDFVFPLVSTSLEMINLHKQLIICIKHPLLLSKRRFLLSDTKLTEDIIKPIFIGDLTRYLAEKMQAAAYVQC